MSSIYLKSDSPFYQLRYYDRLEEDPARRRKTFSTKVKATPSDQKRALGKDKLIGSPEVRKIKKSFEDALFERNLYAKTKIKLRRSPLFSTGFTEFLIEKPNLAAATITLYKFTSSHFVNACGDKDITDYSIEDYSRFIKYCAAHKFSDTTNSIHTRHLFSLFNYFIKKRYIAENIIIKLKTPRRDPEPVPFDDMQIILDYFEQRSFWQYAFVYFLLLTGMRESSALIQTRDDIDIEARVIKAINVKAQHRNFWFPISDELLELLLLMFEKSESENKRLFYMYSLTGAGLKFWRRGMINLTTPDRVTGKTKIKYKYQMKQLRKTFPSWLANAGVERGILKDLLDHSNISITENHYLKIEAQRYLRDVNKVRFKTKIP